MIYRSIVAQGLGEPPVIKMEGEALGAPVFRAVPVPDLADVSVSLTNWNIKGVRRLISKEQAERLVKNLQQLQGNLRGGVTVGVAPGKRPAPGNRRVWQAWDFSASAFDLNRILQEAGMPTFRF